MRQARCDLPQQLSPDAHTSGRWKDADAHQFEVATEPVSSNVGSEGLGDTIGPPLAVVAGVSVGKADERAIDVGAHETESGARGVLPPNRVQPVVECRRVAEHLVIKGPEVYSVGVGNRVVTLETKWHSPELPSAVSSHPFVRRHAWRTVGVLVLDGVAASRGRYNDGGARHRPVDLAVDARRSRPIRGVVGAQDLAEPADQIVDVG